MPVCNVPIPRATIAKATGDASRFRQLADQYRKAPEITRKRLYLETMQEVLASNQKVIAERNNNILYLPLNGANPAAASAPTTMPAVKAAISAASNPNTQPERPARGDDDEGNR